MIKKIGFDVDNTITDTHEDMIGRFLAWYREKYHKEPRGKIQYYEQNLVNIFPEVPKEEIEEFNRTEWEEYAVKKAKPRKNIVECFKMLKNLGVEIHIITARYPKENETEEDVKAYTHVQLESFGLIEGKDYDEIHAGFEDKENIIKMTGVEIMVEDTPKQAINISKFIPVFLVDTPYNKNIFGSNIWRINNGDYEPKVFVDKIKFAMDHIENDWQDEYEPEKKEPPYIIKDNMIIANAGKLKENPRFIFLLSVREKGIITKDNELVLFLKSKYKKAFAFDLSFSMHHLRCVREDKKEKTEVLDHEQTSSYIENIKAIKKQIAVLKKEKTVNIMIGHEIMLLPRKEQALIKDYPVIFTDCGEREIFIAKKNMMKKDYNIFLLFEDLTEVSTQIRKWRIIAETAGKELEKISINESAGDSKSHPYINRQWCDSDGVDRVNLLSGEKPFQPEVLNNILSENVFVIGDLHLSTKDKKKTELIVKNINSRIGRNDHLLFLGDFDGKKGTGSYQLTKDTLKRFITKNIYLILGNNDPYTIEEYAKMGFKSVVDIASFRPSYGSFEKIVLTHCPLPVKEGELNIHGHIHGSRCYWNVDWEKCCDVWDADYTPHTIKECIDRIENGLYQATTEIHKRY